MNRPLLRLHASFRRLRPILLFTALWFAAGLAGFHWGNELSWWDSFLAAFYFEIQTGKMAQGYVFWGQSIIFGVFVTLVMRETLENHVERCRSMSELVKDHTIIIGYSHLGERLVQHCIDKKMPYVVIELKKELVDDLLRRNEPVVVDDARSKDALPAANIKQAKRLIVASNNIETALIVTKRARDANPGLEILVRCNFDDFTDLLEKLGADKVYSTSLTTFQALSTHMDGAVKTP